MKEGEVVVAVLVAGTGKVMEVQGEWKDVVGDYQEIPSAAIPEQDLLLENQFAEVVEREDVGRESRSAGAQGFPEESQAVENSGSERETLFVGDTDTLADLVPTETL